MKKQIIVKQKHRYSKERSIMYQGVSEFVREDGGIKLSYHEQNSGADVEVRAFEKHMEIRRNAEVRSFLTFLPSSDSTGVVSSGFGDVQVGIYTYKYSKKDNVIALEYDILGDGEGNDGYQIIWSIKEG